MILSSSRDKSVIMWTLTRQEGTYGYPRRALTGHGHFVQDVVISSDGQFALSGSWDGTLRLWDLNTGTTTRRFVGHTKVRKHLSGYGVFHALFGVVYTDPLPIITLHIHCS